MFFFAFDKFGGSGDFFEVDWSFCESGAVLYVRGKMAGQFRNFVCILGRCILTRIEEKSLPNVKGLIEDMLTQR